MRQFLKIFFIYFTAFLPSAPASQLIAQPTSKQEEAEEQLVTTVTKDSLQLSGLLLKPRKTKTNKTGVIWVHGAGQNFYYPSYVQIARQMAARGYAFLTINTRMHDIGCFLSYKDEVALRGGTYWGIPSKVSLDIEAWIEEMVKNGYDKVVLVGHSAGGPAVRAYQASTNDKRVGGIVMASVAIGTTPLAQDTAILPVARKMVNEGHGQDLLPMLRLSAATYLDYSNAQEDNWDFYGTRPTTAHPGIALINCPFLAWFGTSDDVGGLKDLYRLKQLIKAQRTGPSMLTTALVEGANHLYDGSEEKIAEILSDWISGIK